MYQTARTPRGFTLIELLIVILIFGWILSVVIPSMSRAKEQARAASCGQNLRILAAALEAYSANYDRRYPDLLEQMVPQQIPEMPKCPSAGSSTYVSGYVVAFNPACYTLSCDGANHTNAGLAPGFPRYELRSGLREGP